MKKIFVTTIRAIDPVDGRLKTWRGQNVEAESWEDAELWCRENAGYLKVDGEYVCEIEYKRNLNLN